MGGGALTCCSAPEMFKPTWNSQITAALFCWDDLYKCVWFSLAFLSPLSPFAGTTVAARRVFQRGCGVCLGGGTRIVLIVILQHCRPTPFPVFLSWFPVGLKRSSFKENKKEEEKNWVFECGVGVVWGSWLGWASAGRMTGCWRGSGFNFLGEYWLHYWNFNVARV